MHSQSFSGPKLPKALLERVGSSKNIKSSTDHGRSSRNGSNSRRKHPPRLSSQNGNRCQNHTLPTSAQNAFGNEEFLSDSSGEEIVMPPSRSLRDVSKPVESKPFQVKTSKTDKEAKPHQQESQVSRGFRDRLAQDDAEIAALEKKLGLKGKSRKSKSFEADGLDSLLDSSDDTEQGANAVKKRKREDYTSFLANKRQSTALENTSIQNVRVESDSDSNGSIDSTSHSILSEASSDDSSPDEDQTSFNGFSEADHEPSAIRRRENPYVAPSAPETKFEKYVPPSRRTASDSDAASVARLKKRLQGLFNRLSPANISTIMRDVEQIYQTNPRGLVSITLTDLLIGLLADQTRLGDPFIVLHAGFIAALYKVVGIDFAAQMIERITQVFDEHFFSQNESIKESKTPANLIASLAMLYVLQVIGCTMIFDYIRIFLRSLSERNTELLLVVIKTCGQNLRQDDPSSLKDIVIILQESAAAVDEGVLSVRTKFMIETMNNLKNNRMKGGAGMSSVLMEHTDRMKKTLNLLTARNGQSNEPLRFSLQDVRNAEKTGKWWLVGASWKGKVQSELKSRDTQTPQERHEAQNGADEVSEMAQLAREQGMNTEVRRAIFISIMSATDFEDARLRLLKLHLKKSQELEIPRVLNQCVGAEKSYNPYYTLISRKLCSDRKFMKAFQFGLWDLFRRMGEHSDNDSSEDDGEKLTTHQVVNYARTYGSLMAQEALPLTSLGKLKFTRLKVQTKAFLEILLTTIFLESRRRSRQNKDELLVRLFERTASDSLLVNGLLLFLSQIDGETSLSSSEKDTKHVRRGATIARDTLSELQHNGSRPFPEDETRSDSSD